MDRAGPTIRDIAAKAGCSIATVSRVANGTGQVSAELCDRVAKAANALGLSLGTSSRKPRATIGVLAPSIANPVFAAALSGVEHCARQNGLATIIAQSAYASAQEEAAVASMLEERPLGVVLTVCDPKASRAIALLADRAIPFATLYNAPASPEVAAVAVDDRQAMRDLTSEIAAFGHRSILFVGGRFASSDRSKGRYEGYREGMRRAALEPAPALQVDFIDAEQDIDLTEAMHRFAPTAIVASNDLLALTVIGALRRLGLSVPQDVSVTGFDGIDLGRHVSPRLTTVVQPSRAMGALAAKMVIDIAEGERRPEHLWVEAHLERGETVAAPRQLSHPETSPTSPLETSKGSSR
jgi:DNA-binding LacI/PurR family transcriptional regulator